MGHVIAVMPASGGVGATTFAAVLAVRAAESGQPVVAVDLDRFGGRLDVVLGVEQEEGWRWDHLGAVAGVVDGAGLARELPRVGALPVLSGAGVGAAARPSRPPSVPGPRGPGEGERRWLDVVPDVVGGLAAAHGVTVLDLGRDGATVEAAAPFVDAWVAVVGTGVPQLASAAVSVPLLRRHVDAACARGGRPLGAGVLRRPCEPWVVLRGARIEDDVADAVCDHLDIPVVARVRDDLRLVGDVTCGVAPGTRGRGAAVEAADELLLRLVSRPPVDLSLRPAPPGVGGPSPELQSSDRSESAESCGPTRPSVIPPGDEPWRWSA
ncbi:hypothetical protein [Intrasporangium sp. DVR]|uniref:hypothetical protein n=1 Tax=Intrasporangium sp. DVR TaxID=3127867 RepID=UPI003341C98A